MSYKFLAATLGIFLLTAVAIAGIYIVLNSNNKNHTTIKKNNAPNNLEKDFLTYAWIPYWDQQNAMQTVYKHPEMFDKVGLFWYKLTPEGEITTYAQAIEDRRFVDFAHENNIQVLALIANLPEEGENSQNWDPERVENVINSENSRQDHIEDLVNLVVYNNFDGLALDYENLQEEQKNDFSKFVEELSRALHEKNKTLEIAIHPKTSNNTDEYEGALAQDYTNLANAVDKMHFMMYTQNSTATIPAPPTTLGWAESVLQFAQNQDIPNEKIIFGVGLMGTHWQISGNNFESTSSDLTYEYIQKELNKTDNVNRIRDQNTMSLEASYEENGIFHVVWYNDAQSVQKMVKFAKENNLAGVSFWRLGGEDPKIWRTPISFYLDSPTDRKNLNANS